MQKVKGTLIPIGGNEKKGTGKSERDSLEFIEEGILAHVVRESGGPSALIVVIPTASSIPIEVGESYLDAFTTLGCSNIKVLNIQSKKDAGNANNLEIIRSANCVMFSGGNQSKITNKIGGTQMHQILMDRYKNESGFVIAGTSAGAMAMSKEMIAGGSSTEAFYKGTVKMYQGLGLTPEIMFDTHFIMRGRFGRISEALAKFPDLIGIGLAEDTGLIVKEGNEMTVIGSGMVIIFDGSKLEHNKENFLDEGTPMTLTNMIVHVLSNSDKYYIQERKVSVLPINASFH